MMNNSMRFHISYDETTGIDFIPNEVLKCNGIFHFMYKLFHYIFENCIVPSIWLRTIINPIPKGSGRTHMCQ